MKKTLRQSGRVHVRYGISSLAMVSLPGTGEVLDALVSNVSQGGIGLYTESALPIGCEVSIQVTFLQTNGNQEVTEVIPGRVRWVKPLQNHFVVGISFTALDSDRHAGLMDTISAAGRGEC